MEAALEHGFDVIALDAGSVDPGPYYLGCGKSFTSRAMVKRDLKLIVEAGQKAKVPVLVGSACGAGATPHLDWTMEILDEIVEELGIHPKIARIDAEMDKRMVVDAFRGGRVENFETTAALKESDITDCEHIVAQMGIQPYIEALKAGADIIIGGRAYVANSGGYRAPNYDSTVSVIELETMRQMYKIDVAINLSRIKADAYGNLWVSSRGNYDDVPSNLYRLEPNGGRYQVAEAMNIPASNMTVSGDSLYVYSVEYSNQTSKNTVTYAIIDVKKKRVVSRKFITDGTELDIVIPYGIAIHPRNGDIYVTDAKNYVSSGVLHCYSREGVRKWSVRTGDIPAHMVFLERKQPQR